MAGHWPMKRQSSLLEHCYFYLVKITHGELCTGIQALRCINSTVIHPFTATYTAPSCLWDGCNSPKCSRSFTLWTVLLPSSLRNLQAGGSSHNAQFTYEVCSAKALSCSIIPPTHWTSLSNPTRHSILNLHSLWL